MKRSTAVEVVCKEIDDGTTSCQDVRAIAERVVAALENNQPWDPEEPELPTLRLSLRGDHAYADDSGWHVAVPVAGGGGHPGAAWAARIFAAMVAAYNREREDEALLTGPEAERTDTGLSKILRREIQEQVDAAIETERAALSEATAALQRLASRVSVALDAGPGAVADAVLAKLADDTAAARRSFFHGKDEGVKIERARCLSHLDWLASCWLPGWDFATRMTVAARGRIERGEAARPISRPGPFAGQPLATADGERCAVCGKDWPHAHTPEEIAEWKRERRGEPAPADVVPVVQEERREEPRDWPEEMPLLSPEAWTEAARRWKSEPELRRSSEHNAALAEAHAREVAHLREEVERLRAFEDETLGLRDRIKRTEVVLRTAGSVDGLDKALRTLTGKETGLRGKDEETCSAVITEAIEHMEAAWPGVTTKGSWSGSPLARLAAILLRKES